MNFTKSLRKIISSSLSKYTQLNLQQRFLETCPYCIPRVAVILPMNRPCELTEKIVTYFRQQKIHVDCIRLYDICHPVTAEEGSSICDNIPTLIPPQVVKEKAKNNKPVECKDKAKTETKKTKNSPQVYHNLSLNWVVLAENFPSYNCVILPSGCEESIRTMLKNNLLSTFLHKHENCPGYIAAIGNSILVLCCFKLGIGKCLTIDSNIKYFVEKQYGLLDQDVVSDNMLITARAPEMLDPFLIKIKQELLY